MRDHYLIKYRVEIGKFTKAQLQDADCGGCDDIIIHSILHNDDGSRNEAIISARGKDGKQLSVDELFKSWVTMAHMLSKDETLGRGRRDLALFIRDIVRCAIRGDDSNGSESTQRAIESIESYLNELKGLAKEK